jgi:hypothetical protein
MNSTVSCENNPVEGVVLQPYWIFLVSQFCFTFFSLVWNSFGYDKDKQGTCAWFSYMRSIRGFLITSRGYLTLITAYHIFNFGYFIYLSFVVEHNGFSFDTLWSNYEHLYARFMNTGVVTAFVNILAASEVDRMSYESVEEAAKHAAYIEKLMWSLFALMVPVILTHIIPATAAYVSLIFFLLLNYQTLKCLFIYFFASAYSCLGSLVTHK